MTVWTQDTRLFQISVLRTDSDGDKRRDEVGSSNEGNVIYLNNLSAELSVDFLYMLTAHVILPQMNQCVIIQL